MTNRLRSCCVLLCLWGIAGPITNLDAQDSPNILFIAIDDQNDWVGCLEGHPQVKTPRIDALAQRGVLFSNAHCQSPLCNPSRTSLLTGLRPSTTGVYGLAPWFRNLPEWKSTESLPQFFKRHGYCTLTAGKIYHGGYGRRKTDQEWDVIGPGAGVGAKPPEKLVKTPSSNPLVDWGTFPHRDEDKGDWKVASWAVEQLEQRPEEPFFLSVGFFLPHVPCYATQQWFDLYPEVELPPIKEDDRDDTPRASWHLHWKLPEPRLRFLREAKQEENIVRSYLACTSFVDAQVGRVLDALEANGLSDNTIVVLWSDHGFHLGEKLITGKNTLWEESTRVPLVFAGPGVPPQQICRQPAELLDIYPTLAELCGFDAPKHLEGLSLGPQIRDAETTRGRPAITTHNQGNHSVRSLEQRYIRYADGSEEFYDLASDPQEHRNLIDDPNWANEIGDHRRWIPKVDVVAAPGSAARILEYRSDGIFWEGKPILPTDPIPEFQDE